MAVSRACAAAVALSVGLVVAMAPAFAVAAEADPAPSRGKPGRHEALTRVDVTAEPPRPIDALDELSAPRLPTPFSLPELSHPRFDAGAAWTIGGAIPERAGGRGSAIGLFRVTGETHVGLRRRLYLGVTIPLALARPIDAPSASGPMLGNVELQGRVVFPMPTWLQGGAVLGFTAPTARFDRNGPEAEATRIASSLEPTDMVHFLTGRVAIRPAFDLRVLRGRFVGQVRQGYDVVIDGSGAGPVSSYGRLLAHLGFLASPDLELSLEATQSYLLSSTRSPPLAPIDGAAFVSPRRRSATTFAPGARFSFGHIDLGAQVVTDLIAPLATNVQRVLALRLSMVAHIR
jgi:hypothetical protein